MVRYLKALLSRLRRSSKGREPSVHLPAESSERATCFILSSNQFSATKQRIKYSAFLPSPKHGNKSAFVIDGLSEPQVWELGLLRVAGPQNKVLYARGDLGRDQIILAGLSLHVDDTPARHAIIGSWPSEKDRQMEIAQELARAAKFVASAEANWRT